MPHTIRLLIVLAILAVVSCGDGKPAERSVSSAADSVRSDSMARAHQDSTNRARPDYVVDSILPMGEALRRFRASLPGDSATRLHSASSSRETLVRRFVTALAAGDTADLQAMAITPREFADLYFPESPFMHPPYQQPPALAWTMIQNPSRSGLVRLLRRVASTPLQYVGHRCNPTPSRQGANVLHEGCLIRLVEATGDTVSRRWFGSILERDGRFKLMSYTNQL